jgi:hypothetical protein
VIKLEQKRYFQTENPQKAFKIPTRNGKASGDVIEKKLNNA